jgi:hypothetical protein
MPEKRVTAQQKKAVVQRAQGCSEYCRSQARFAHPRQQRWSEHFAWNDDFTIVIGLTPTGRATVETLQLNRDGVVNLRQILYLMGEHPPAELND